MAKSVEARFLEKTAPGPNGCLEWTGTRDRYGYGRFRLHGPGRRAHRVSYGLFKGPIPENYDVHHRCENRGCVNPDHLMAVSRAEHARLSRSANKVRCQNGHLFDEENTYIKPDGCRSCRACNREAAAQYRARRNAAAIGAAA